MTPPEEVLRDRLVRALLLAGPTTGEQADAILALGELEARWEVRGGDPHDPDDRWVSYPKDEDAARALANRRLGAEVFAGYSLRFAPISVDGAP